MRTDDHGGDRRERIGPLDEVRQQREGEAVRIRARHEEPIFNVPGAVLALLAAFAAVHALRDWLPARQSAEMTFALAFIPARYSGLAAEIPGGTTAEVTSFLTHAFVHGDLAHLAINSLWLTAFGTPIARRAGSLRFLAFFAFCAVMGAAVFLVCNIGLLAPMVGASGAISGMMGASMRFLFRGLEEQGLSGLRETPHLIPLMTVGEALSDRRVLTTTGVWLAINMLALVGLGGLGGGGEVAWEAHIGGYAAGLFAYGLFDPVRPRRLPEVPRRSDLDDDLTV